jgi:hypothetical protein
MVAVLPVVPVPKYCAVYNLGERSYHGMKEFVTHRANGKVPGVLNGNSVAQNARKAGPFTAKLSIFSGTLVQPLGDFSGARLQQSSRLSSVFATGSTRESRFCRSTFSNPNPTPNTIARNVFTAP